MAVHEIKASWVHRLWGLGAPQTFPLGFIGMLHVLNSRGNGYLFLTEVFLFHSFPHFLFFIAHSEHVLSDHQANAGRTQTEHVWKRKYFYSEAHTWWICFYLKKLVPDDPVVAEPHVGREKASRGEAQRDPAAQGGGPLPGSLPRGSAVNAAGQQTGGSSRRTRPGSPASQPSAVSCILTIE